jgi:SAM-dependent methyltransferase
MNVRRVLDVGCGPGTNAAQFAQADYVGIDINENYLQVARTKHKGRFIGADLERADLNELGVFDTVIVNSFLHHLCDESVHRVLRQVHERLEPDGRVHILELVDPKRFSMATLMAALDRGEYARPLTTWLGLFSEHFDVVEIESYFFGRGLWAMVYFQGRRRPCVSP